MKETVYGNYPPARDPWRTYRKTAKERPYNEECLYKHWNSKYNDKSGVPTPEAPTPIKMHLSTRPSSKPATPARSPSQPFTPVHLAPAPAYPAQVPQSPVNINYPRAEIVDPRMAARRSHSAFRPPPSRSGSRPLYSAKPRPSTSSTSSLRQQHDPASIGLQVEGRSASPIRMFSPTAQPRSRSSSRVSVSVPKPWAMKVAETNYSMVPQPPSEDRAPLPSHSTKPDRVKSASVTRPKVSPPERPIKSADPRQRTPLAGEVSLGEELEEDTDENEETKKEEEGEEVVPWRLGVDFPLDYDEQLEKNGWRMQVPGDPLNLKRPCIAKRGTFTVSLQTQPIAPDPPKVHIESSEPYFYNTIPRRPMTFTIHQDWASEVLLAKRLELQKRDGDRYKYKQNHFSFLY